MYELTMDEVTQVAGGNGFTDALGVGTSGGAVGGAAVGEMMGGGMAAIAEGAAYGGVVGAAVVIGFGGGYILGHYLVKSLTNWAD